MKCGIVVLNYNDYEGTRDFIYQIKDYDNIDKIVIVDNCSTDESGDKLKHFKSEKISVILSEENKGYAAGNNIGIKYLINKFKVRYVIVSNPDIIIKEDAICECLKFLENNKGYAIATVKMIEKNNSHTSIAWKLPNFLDCILLTFPLISKIANCRLNYPKEYFNTKVSDVEVVPGSFFVARGKYIEDVEYMDEETFLYCEENILGYKLKSKGYKLAVINSNEYIHNHSITINKNIKGKIEKFKILNRSRIVYVEKYLKVGALRLFVFKILLKIGITVRKIVELLSRGAK